MDPDAASLWSRDIFRLLSGVEPEPIEDVAAVDSDIEKLNTAHDASSMVVEPIEVSNDWNEKQLDDNVVLTAPEDGNEKLNMPAPPLLVSCADPRLRLPGKIDGAEETVISKEATESTDSAAEDRLITLNTLENTGAYDGTADSSESAEVRKLNTADDGVEATKGTDDSS